MVGQKPGPSYSADARADDRAPIFSSCLLLNLGQAVNGHKPTKQQEFVSWMVLFKDKIDVSSDQQLAEQVHFITWCCALGC